MTVSTIELYEALVAAGVDEASARNAAKAVLSREEATELLATKTDLERAFKTQNMWIAGLFVASASAAGAGKPRPARPQPERLATRAG